MLSNILKKFLSVNYKIHLIFIFLLHVFLIVYGKYHDDNYAVPFTDIDYSVFTDAARHVLEGGSPYTRHTFRYTPIIAFVVFPNLIVHPCFGKYLFSAINIAIALLIRLIVKHNVVEYNQYVQKRNLLNLTNFESKQKRKTKRTSKTIIESHADNCMMMWLYNPMAIVIAARGNCDSVAGLLVLSTLYLIQCKKRTFAAGIIHGISIHTRLYPAIYSLALFMYLSKFSFYSPNYRRMGLQVDNKKKRTKIDVVSYKNRKKTIFKFRYVLYFVPNWEQIKLITGCLISLSAFTLAFYILYGFEFLHETYLYHLIRRDTRHNFSIYFYLQYLTAGVKNTGSWQKILTILPQIILLLVFSVRYGLNKLTLNFAFLTLTIVTVTYNTVLTSQYFIWVLVVLPLCVWQIKLSKMSAFFLVCIWFVAQASWLLPAYLLEFQGHNTFMFIWIQSVSFFCANMAILGRIIKNFMSVTFEHKSH